MLQNAVRLTGFCPEYGPARSPDRLFARDAGNFLGCPVKRGYTKIPINRKQTVGNAVDNNLYVVETLKVHK
jgi:hypothetical protein